MKTILGVKLTHDASIAIIQGNELLFSVELEKIGNGARYRKAKSWMEIWSVIKKSGINPNEIDTVVIDGWKDGIILPPFNLPVARYHEFDGPYADPLTRRDFGDYVSYNHMSGHILGAYATSPGASERRECAVISWDGGQEARVHFVNPKRTLSPVTYMGTAVKFYGTIYGILSYYFGPYKRVPTKKDWLGGYDTPGKLMSYIALGKYSPALYAELERIYAYIPFPTDLCYNQSGNPEHQFCQEVIKARGTVSDEDTLLTIHTFLENLLVAGARRIIPKGMDLCFVGGSALNIKWNSALRECGYFGQVWVPPFPNDSGSALGAAVCEMVKEGKLWDLKWDVYCGPLIDPLPVSDTPEGWSQKNVSPFELGVLISLEKNHPFVVLHGKAELGPRALGHRSILMSPERLENKVILNDFKKREPFRPVAPLAMAGYTNQIFFPGVEDPYMLFDHHVNSSWREVIPAVVHLDNTARLQTVSEDQCPVTWQILDGHHSRTQIPLVCNTSANYNGYGFFPSTLDALTWATSVGVKRVWVEGLLYEKE